MPKILTLGKVVCCRKWPFVGMDVWFRGSGGRGNGVGWWRTKKKKGMYVWLFSQMFWPLTRKTVCMSLQVPHWCCNLQQIDFVLNPRCNDMSLCSLAYFPAQRVPAQYFLHGRVWWAKMCRNGHWVCLFVCFPRTSLLALCACIHTLRYYIHFLNDSYPVSYTHLTLPTRSTV